MLHVYEHQFQRETVKVCFCCELKWQMEIWCSLNEIMFNVFNVFFFSLWGHLWQTIKNVANFLCNLSLHRNKKLLIPGQFFCQSSWKLVQNEKHHSLTAIYRNQTTIETSKLGTMYFFERTNLIVCHFSKIWKFNNSKKSKLDQNGAKFVYDIPTVIKRSISITMVFFRG